LLLYLTLYDLCDSSRARVSKELPSSEPLDLRSRLESIVGLNRKESRVWISNPPARQSKRQQEAVEDMTEFGTMVWKGEVFAFTATLPLVALAQIRFTKKKEKRLNTTDITSHPLPFLQPAPSGPPKRCLRSVLHAQFHALPSYPASPPSRLPLPPLRQFLEGVVLPVVVRSQVFESLVVCCLDRSCSQWEVAGKRPCKRERSGQSLFVSLIERRKSQE
jgi:hypothetical protein